MKLCILGGGGFRTPYVYQALLRDHGSPRIDEVVLQDVDDDRLRSMAGLLRQLAESFPDAPSIVETTDLDVALAGSDFVFTAVRIGGLAARCCDERVALDLGVLGQETTGPGGLAFALRTVPFMLHVAARLKVLAPDAWLLNFTNPAGIVTEAVQRVLGDRALGICDTPSGLGRRVAGLLGLDAGTVQLDYVGLNHLGWMRRVLSDGVDVLPRLLADDAALSGMEEGVVFGPSGYASSDRSRTSTCTTTTSSARRSARSWTHSRPGESSCCRPSGTSTSGCGAPVPERWTCGGTRSAVVARATWPRPRAASRATPPGARNRRPTRPTRDTPGWRSP